MDCRSCGSELPEKARFCGQCGTPLAGAANGAENMAQGPPALRRADASLNSAPAPAPLWRRRKVLASSAAIVAVLVAALVATGWKEHWPSAVFGAANSSAQAAIYRAPVGALEVVANLVSRNPATVRESLASVYAAQAGAAALAPAGTRIRVQSGSWRQQGADGSLRAWVTIPGGRPAATTVYLVREEGRWRVLFTGAP